MVPEKETFFSGLNSDLTWASAYWTCAFHLTSSTFSQGILNVCISPYVLYLFTRSRLCSHRVFHRLNMSSAFFFTRTLWVPNNGAYCTHPSRSEISMIISDCYDSFLCLRPAYDAVWLAHGIAAVGFGRFVVLCLYDSPRRGRLVELIMRTNNIRTAVRLLASLSAVQVTGSFSLLSHKQTFF